jgi:hypothetical protein
MNVTGKDFLAVPSENTFRLDIPEGKILSMHPVISCFSLMKGSLFSWR